MRRGLQTLTMMGAVLALTVLTALTAVPSLAQGEPKEGAGAATKPAAAAVTAAVGQAQTESPRPGELHGGALVSTPAGNFETVFAADGIRIYLYTSEKTPAMVEGQTGSVVLKIAGGANEEVRLTAEAPAEKEPGVYFCPMHSQVVQMTPGQCKLCGGMTLYEQNRLFGKADLSKVKPGAVTAEIKIRGLQGKLKEASFSATNAPAEAPAPAKAKG
jgi:hypothetical protein